MDPYSKFATFTLVNVMLSLKDNMTREKEIGQSLPTWQEKQTNPSKLGL